VLKITKKKKTEQNIFDGSLDGLDAEFISRIERFLKHLEFTEIYKKFFEGTNHTIYSFPKYVFLTLDRLLPLLESNTSLTEQEKVVIRFFVLGDKLSIRERNTLFADNVDLFHELVERGIVVEDRERKLFREEKRGYRLEALSFVSFALPTSISNLSATNQTSGELLLVMDLPLWLSYEYGHERVQIDSSAARILELVAERVSIDKLQGNFVDFGSGAGPLALALLKLNPRAIAVGFEISPRARFLAGFNAILNNLSDRFLQIDNSLPLETIEEQLKANGLREFSLVVSNPPAFPVPREFIESFPTALAGGEYGFEKIELFIRQISKRLAFDGNFFITADLGLHRQGQPLLSLRQKALHDELLLQLKDREIQFKFYPLPGVRSLSTFEFAEALVRSPYIYSTYYEWKRYAMKEFTAQHLADNYSEALLRSGIDRIKSYLIEIQVQPRIGLLVERKNDDSELNKCIVKTSKKPSAKHQTSL
jgi:SAM-dependent methyltransferase